MIVSPDFWLSSLTEESQENQKDKTNLIIFGCLVLGSFIFAAARAFCFLQAAVRCSERLHDKMTVAILEAPALFFDSNLVCRILNRFSKDTGCMDEVLPKAFLFAIQLVLAMLFSILVPTVANPWLLFVAVPMAVAVVYISQYYLKTSRQLKRLESINRSPAFSHISDTIDGLETIRTRARQKDFEEQFTGMSYSINQLYFTISRFKKDVFCLVTGEGQRNDLNISRSDSLILSNTELKR